MLSKSNRRRLLACGMIFILLFIGSAIVKQSTPVSIPAFKYDSVLRFHVIANSDSETDQAIKLEVRNRSLQFLQPLLAQTTNVSDAKKVVSENLSHIQKLARDIVVDYGLEYTVTAEMGSFTFPARLYDNIVLPAGDYDALRISLGQGGGQNWWCVLFPPLCFVNGSGGLVFDDSQWSEEEESLQPVFAPVSDNESSQASIRFKFWEWWSK
ncbi:MAG: stage II sporulation protein R [Syntrophomonadaceae bacterium]|nr:stage II sporulation protein R [Syntrophomonadaceae bacterium]